ncbi:MAG: hypothetical protein ACE5JD_14845 [Candidatus Methylomirabilia bacterium]
MSQYLCIVARGNPYLYHALSRDLPGVEVLVDRRFRERRQRGQAHDLDRRRTDRRCLSDTEDELRSVGFAIQRAAG